ncbi:hypothetical protein QSH57_013251 [Fusarium oxysporum f. sp. vasinfectum]|nr:hypothetical protein QSH57_013251 [Fusarium oxysporum f. sp. vasinfectum]
MSGSKKTVLMIGGTGAQGAAVVKALSDDSAYEIRVLTRSAASPAAAELAALPDVTIMEGNPYEEATLQHAFDAVELAWVNTNGFAIGGEERDLLGHTYVRNCTQQWRVALPVGIAAVRVEAGRLRPPQIPHRAHGWQGQGRRLHQRAADEPHEVDHTDELHVHGDADRASGATAESRRSRPDGVRGATGGNGRPPLIYLADLGRYARWVFDNPGRSNGMNLMVATENIGWECLAKTFTEVTGKKKLSTKIFRWTNYLHLVLFRSRIGK